jgi:predicted glycosyltransferase involved in capsule biosynthesis
MRELAGVLCKDWMQYQISFSCLDNKYLQLSNRLERISESPLNIGYVCLWPHTSRLHAPLVMPSLGKQLLNKCLNKSFFEMKEHRELDIDIEVSVLIGHRGIERLPLLLSTLRSIASQIEVGLECIVIEQDKIPRIKQYLPPWVKYLFLKTHTDSTTYNRSAAFNLGAEYASGRILLLHDNDMLVPNTYCKSILCIANRGYDAINTKRYVFYMSCSDTERIIRSTNSIAGSTPDYIIQNLEAGGSMAITRRAYIKLGGMDEEFVGWGGEDIELWKRCSLLRRWIWGYEPIVHLWHQSQPLKERIDNPNIERIKTLNAYDLKTRIDLLCARFKRI